ncbi:DUF6304 family protein [Streptomyces pseudovenezuelae]|uniref:Barstar (barnase inhibitor) domain-containing protein n=1 Tax=Streptomyces pseudovenezuelae TaxID=67350 RepID=A0ABT6LDD7_9ACTN|nr:DUF6304 family protein [Streptomyces pseudovenezuelae]MDH6213389.1 hypothetical protein [Streptomyces pseudovenezuelae]
MTKPAYWPVRYTDRHGAQDVVFESDGREVIRATIRGVLFEGDTMDDLGALSGEPPEQAFSFFDGALCSCLLEWEVPIPVEVRGSGVRPAVLHCALRLGAPAGPRKGLDAETLTTLLRLDGREYRNADDQDDFEDALHEVQRQLPRAARLKACVSCAWSDYHPVGHGLMGGLACFRDVKELYRQVDGKHGPHGIFAVWPSRTEFVQETWLCGEFEHRVADRGYRGPFPYRRL